MAREFRRINAAAKLPSFWEKAQKNLWKVVRSSVK
jgi:hypothetical protein